MQSTTTTTHTEIISMLIGDNWATLLFIFIAWLIFNVYWVRYVFRIRYNIKQQEYTNVLLENILYAQFEKEEGKTDEQHATEMHEYIQQLRHQVWPQAQTTATPTSSGK